MSVLNQLVQPLAAQPGVKTAARQRVARMWLMFAIMALGLSTLQAILLVLARVPGISVWLPESAFFTALVLHVDLSILVWFGAFAAFIWCCAGAAAPRLAPWLAIAGATLMLTAALVPDAVPLMNNYLPVLDSRLFLLGLLVFAAAVSWQAAAALPLVWRREADAITRLAGLAALIWWLALAMLPLVGWPAAAGSHGEDYFERLFWGAGHVMQFAHVLLMLAVWALLAERGRIDTVDFRRKLWFWLSPGLLVLAVVPFLPWIDGSRGLDQGRIFTLWMAVTGWLLVVPVALRYVWLLLRKRAATDAWLATVLALSIALYLGGAIAGSFIRGDNLMVPAHYHGAIGAVTLAYMSLGLLMIPQLEGQSVAVRAARVQAGLYGGGLLMLIGGLAYAGWLGLARKTPAPMLTGEGLHYLGLSLAVAGGGMALAGSFYFVYLGLRAMLGRLESVSAVESNE